MHLNRYEKQEATPFLLATTRNVEYLAVKELILPARSVRDECLGVADTSLLYSLLSG